MANVQTFMFALPAGTATMQVPVRTLQLDGAPWFLGIDIYRCLGLSANNQRSAYAKLSADERRNIDRITVGLPAGRPMAVISESGLYKLVMRSDKPEARKFQDWVTRDVLPAIRKDGGYIMGEEERHMDALRDSLQRPHHHPPPISHASAKGLQRVTHGLPEGHPDHERPDLRYRR